MNPIDAETQIPSSATKLGSVSVSWSDSQGELGAHFSTGNHLNCPAPKRMGACYLTGDDCDPGSTEPISVSAGPITATIDGMSSTLSPDSNLDYGQPLTPPPGGTIVEIHAAGGDVPGFSTKILVPSAISVTAMPADIPRSQDLDLTWTVSKPAGWVIFDIGDGTRDVACAFAEADGHGTIPAAALESLGAGPGHFGYSAETAALVSVSGWEIESLGAWGPSVATPDISLN